MKRIPLAQVRATFPVLKNPANRHRAVGFTFEQWQYAFTNTFPEAGGRLYDRYHIPASGHVFWGSALGTSTRAPTTTTSTTRTPTGRRSSSSRGPRTPHAFLPPALEREALQGGGARHRGPGVRRTAPVPSQDGWEEVADDALTWAVEQAASWAADRRVSSTS